MSMELKKSVTVSRSRKINLSLYDKSKGYESEDFFVSMGEEVNAESSKEEVDKVYEKLMSDCDTKLREVVKNRITELVTPKEKPVDPMTLAKAPLKTYKLEKPSENKLTKEQKNNVRVEKFKKENPDKSDGTPF